jgi:hypothetical protein
MKKSAQQVVTPKLERNYYLEIVSIFILETVLHELLLR